LHNAPRARRAPALRALDIPLPNAPAVHCRFSALFPQFTTLLRAAYAPAPFYTLLEPVLSDRAACCASLTFWIHPHAAHHHLHRLAPVAQLVPPTHTQLLNTCHPTRFHRTRCYAVTAQTPAPGDPAPPDNLPAVAGPSCLLSVRLHACAAARWRALHASCRACFATLR